MSSSQQIEYLAVDYAALQAFHDENYEQALRLLDKALYHHRHVNIYNLRCLTLLQLNRPGEALPDSLLMIQYYRQSIKGYVRCVGILMSIELYREALVLADKAMHNCVCTSRYDNKLLNKLRDMRRELMDIEEQRVRSIRDPLMVLPVELSTYVIELAVFSGNHDLAASLSHVSRLWRQTVLGMPRLWTKASIICSPRHCREEEKLDVYVERANYTCLQDLRCYFTEDLHPIRIIKPRFSSFRDYLSRDFPSLDIVSTAHNKVRHDETITRTLGLLFSNIGRLKYTDENTDPSRRLRLVLPEELLERVFYEADLDSVRLKLETWWCAIPPDTTEWQEYGASWPPRNLVMERFRVSRSQAPPLVVIMKMLPRLKSLEWNMCKKKPAPVPFRNTVNHYQPSLERLIVIETPSEGQKQSQTKPDLDLPNLRHCELVNVNVRMLDYIQRSHRLKHLSVHGILHAHRQYNVFRHHVDKFVGLFEHLSELEVLDVTADQLSVQILEVIELDRLCPKLRSVNLSTNFTAFDGLLAAFIKQRNIENTGAFASIDTLVIKECHKLSSDTIRWAKRHIETVVCDSDGDTN